MTVLSTEPWEGRGEGAGLLAAGTRSRPAVRLPPGFSGAFVKERKLWGEKNK